MLDDGNLRELCKASGGAWGGTTVDEAYEEMLIKIFGQSVFTKFRRENMDDYIEIFRTFEVKKRGISTLTENDTIISLPATLIETYIEETESSLKNAVQNSTVSKFVTPEKGHKLRIKAAIMKNLFSVATDNITKHISDLLKMDVVKGVKTIIMVGGLSESNIVHETVKQSFPNLNVVVPPDAVLTVLKGAVVFGYKPTAITERISRYTYGICTNRPFQDGVHPADKLCYDARGEPWCRDCFDKLIECGRQIKLNEQVSNERYYAPHAITGIGFQVYGSTEPDPTYITDDRCFFVGDFDIDFPDPDNPKNLDKIFWLYFTLGDTELRLEVQDIDTKERYSAQFKLKDV